MGLVGCLGKRTLRNELHVLGGADVLAKVDRVQTDRPAVELPPGLLARKVLLGARLVDLPREETVGNADHLVALRAVAKGSGKGEHGLVLADRIVLEREAPGDRIGDHVRIKRSSCPCHLLLAEELAVAARNVARAHDVAEDVDVLGLGDHRLRVATFWGGEAQSIARRLM